MLLEAAAQAQGNDQPLTVLVHELLKLWPLWVLVGFVAVAREVMSSKKRPAPRARSRSNRGKHRRRRHGRGFVLAPTGVRRDGLSEIDAMTGAEFERFL